MIPFSLGAARQCRGKGRRMLSKSRTRATAAAAAIFVAGFALSCARLKPWRNEPIGTEVNLSFTLKRNLIELPSVRLDDKRGTFLLATATPRTAIDPTFAGGHARTLQMGDKNSVRIDPVSLDLGGTADALIGADAFSRHTITIDYRSGVLIYQKYAMEPADMIVYPYHAEPAVNINVDGRNLVALVDTSSPDTLVLPGPANGRRQAQVRLGGVDFGTIDVRQAEVARPRIGNRLLSHFLVTIDYGRRVVGLWANPGKKEGASSSQ
jgi:hypothetical protein